ncbi:hypothetical protein Tco_0508657 [Tanacetum coccineum]
MHNNIMAAGSKERPPMLGPGRYSQVLYLPTKRYLFAAVEAAREFIPVDAYEDSETNTTSTTENRLLLSS